MKESSRCPYCGADRRNFFRNDKEGKIICSKCGTVVNDKIIDSGPEYRVFGSEDSGKIRVGPPISSKVLDLGINTIISVNSSEYSKGKIKDPLLVQRLKKMDSRTKVYTSRRRNFVKASQVLDEVSPILTLPNYIKEEAMKLYSFALEKDLIKGRSVVPMIAGAVYIACRKLGVPRPLRDISDAFAIKEKELGKSARLLMRKMDIKILPADPASYIPSLCAKLRLPARVETVAIKIIQEAKKKRLAIGKDPIGTSAAAVYLSCRLLKERRTQRSLAEYAGVTEVTVRNRYKNLKKGLKEFIEDVRKEYSPK